MKIALHPVTENQCGNCTLCCKVLGIPELNKPPDQWCSHAIAKKGCDIYADRPQSCRDFHCLWLQGLAPEWARPDKVHAVLRTTTDGRHLVLHEDPGYRGYGRQALREFLTKFATNGHYCVVMCGDERVFIGDPHLLAVAMATSQQEKGKKI